MNAPPRIPPLSPTPPLSRSLWAGLGVARPPAAAQVFGLSDAAGDSRRQIWRFVDGSDTLDYEVAEGAGRVLRSEEHTSELQSQSNFVCRLLLEKKNGEIPMC